MTILRGPGLTVSALLMLQQMEHIVNLTVWRLVYESKHLSNHLHAIHNIYTLSDVENTVKDGDKPYPSVTAENAENAANIGLRTHSWFDSSQQSKSPSQFEPSGSP